MSASHSAGSASVTRKEMNLRVFRREPLPHVFFQPRFEPWFAWNEQFGTLPQELEGLTIRQVYDRIHASTRTFHYYTDQPYPIETTYSPEVKITEKREGDLLKVQYDTPHGPLYEVSKFTVDRTWRTVEFLAKTSDDLPRMKWLLQRRTFRFDAKKFQQGIDYQGDSGVAQYWVPKSPYLALAQQLMKYEDFIFALADRRSDVEEIMQIIDDSYEAMYEQIIGSGLVQIQNFGENIAMAYLSPRYYEQYMLPWYEKRVGQLKSAGIFSHIHIDGYFRELLPYLKTFPHDGFEALTPLPQGDVSLEEIRESIGDKILIDGIPAVLFMDYHPFEELQACVEKITEYFHPRLIMGISDELPQGAGEEGYRRLKWVADWCLRNGGGG